MKFFHLHFKQVGLSDSDGLEKDKGHILNIKYSHKDAERLRGRRMKDEGRWRPIRKGD